MWKEFKEFALKGNMVDLAVGIIIGAAFGALVNSLVNDIIMPPIGLLLGGINFNDLFIALNGQSYPSLEAAQAAAAPTINYGLFITSLINFLILAFVIFLVVKAFNTLRRKPEEAPNTKACPFCASNIPLKATRCPECTSQLGGSTAT